MPSPTPNPLAMSTSTTTPIVLPTLGTNLLPLSTEPVQSSHIDTSLYTHAQNFFSLQAPDDWLMTESTHGVSFTDTQGTSEVYVDVINTGYPLDAESFENFIDYREKNNASEFEIYVEIDRQIISESNAVLVTKQLSNLLDMKTLSTLYQQKGQAVLILDFLTEQDLYNRYQDLLKTITSSVIINSDEVSSLPVYSLDQASVHSNGYFSILIPPYWRLETSGGDHTLVDTITSPDEQAIIQTIVYDDGQLMSGAIAGKLVLSLLRENYTNSVTVQSNDVMADGRERLIWRSTTADYSGITTFETRGSALLVVTVMWSNSDAQVYRDILEAVIASYKYNPSAEG